MPNRMDTNMAARRKPTETSVTESGYKSVNLSPEELKNINIVQEQFR